MHKNTCFGGLAASARAPRRPERALPCPTFGPDLRAPRVPPPPKKKTQAPTKSPKRWGESVRRAEARALLGVCASEVPIWGLPEADPTFAPAPLLADLPAEFKRESSSTARRARRVDPPELVQNGNFISPDLSLPSFPLPRESYPPAPHTVRPEGAKHPKSAAEAACQERRQLQLTLTAGCAMVQSVDKT